ncbi:MAG: carboxymuconolactone decarboxylase family protein [Alphaproteobacteria bacterium]|nr:MAG: carboxymuconolactone decarboxylase family protein [Alphaproteobacteria bacterium]QQR68628.1 MAG: carboxymuconolactone decarboxylase family protein [Alphaproteobacteria bacterium]
MHKNWLEVTGTLSPALKKTREGIPDVMKAFGQMHEAVMKPGALDPKTKELISLALGIAARCDGCIGYHAEAAVKLGASRAEVLEAMGMAIYMGAGPNVMYAAQALEAFDQFAEADKEG